MIQRFLMLLVVTLYLVGCGEKPPVKMNWGKMEGLDRVVGNMNDNSYSTGRTQEPRLNGLGNPVHMTEFEGSYVWADYAAPWCQPCSWQTPQAQKAEQAVPDVIFITIMTGKSTNYNDHATVETARSWANRFSLPQERTLAAELWYKTIPEHRFYSPDGHTLFVHVGTLTAEQIQEVITYYRDGYNRYDSTGVLESWMTFK